MLEPAQPRRLLPARPSVLFALLPLVACASGRDGGSGSDKAELGSTYLGSGRRVSEDGRVVVDDNMDVRGWPIGQYMAALDRDLRTWSQRKLYGDTIKADTEREILEDAIRFRSSLRYDDLVEALQFGPANHRRVAAMGIGFSQIKGGQGPLLAALHDTDSLVVANALTGLGLLAIPETPMGEICTRLQMSADPMVRNNAAYAIQRIASVGGNADCVGYACTTGLLDSEPGVRVQCAITLGLIGETDAVDEVGRLLYDDVGLVAVAAARTLVRLGTDSNAHFGACARLLVEGMFEAAPEVRDRIHAELVDLADRDYEDEEEDWFKWARGLP